MLGDWDQVIVTAYGFLSRVRFTTTALGHVSELPILHHTVTANTFRRMEGIPSTALRANPADLFDSPTVTAHLFITGERLFVGTATVVRTALLFDNGSATAQMCVHVVRLHEAAAITLVLDRFVNTH